MTETSEILELDKANVISSAGLNDKLRKRLRIPLDTK
jgi:hypothetical protein